MDTSNGKRNRGVRVDHGGSLQGLANSCEPETALIHASDIERLGPGPVTEVWIVPIAAEVVAVLPEVVAAVVAPDVVSRCGGRRARERRSVE